MIRNDKSTLVVFLSVYFIPLIYLFLVIRSAILQLPDLFVSAVIPEEEEPGPGERNDADDLKVYHCPVFMNRVSFSFIIYMLRLLKVSALLSLGIT